MVIYIGCVHCTCTHLIPHNVVGHPDVLLHHLPSYQLLILPHFFHKDNACCYLFNGVCHSTLYLFFLPKINANPNKERNTDFGIGTNTKLWRVLVNWFALRGWIWTSPAVPTIWAHFSQGVLTQFSIYVHIKLSSPRFVKLAEYVFEADGEFGEGSGGRPFSRSSSSSPSWCQCWWWRSGLWYWLNLLMTRMMMDFDMESGYVIKIYLRHLHIVEGQV